MVIVFDYVIDTIYIYSWKNHDKIMLYPRSRLFLFTCGVQFDNGVISPLLVKMEYKHLKLWLLCYFFWCCCQYSHLLLFLNKWLIQTYINVNWETQTFNVHSPKSFLSNRIPRALSKREAIVEPLHLFILGLPCT